MKRWFNHTHSVLIIWSMFAIVLVLGMEAVAESAEKTVMERLVDPIYLLWLFGTGVMAILSWSLGRNIKALDDRIKALATSNSDLTTKHDNLAKEVSRLLGEHDNMMRSGGHR